VWKESVIVSTREGEAKHPGLLPQSRDSAGRQMGPECRGELGIVFGRSMGRRFNIFLNSHTIPPGHNLYFLGLCL